MGRSFQELVVHPDAARRDAAAFARAPRALRTQHWEWGRLLKAIRSLGAREEAPFSRLCALVVHLAGRMEPGPFGEFVRDPRFGRAALQLFVDAKQGGLDAHGFEVSLVELPSVFRARARALAGLFSAYEAQKTRLGLIDAADVSWDALRRAREGWPLGLQGIERLRFLGLVSRTQVEAELLTVLAEFAEREGVEFELAVPGTGNPRLDAPSESLFRAFERRPELSPTSIIKGLAEGPLQPTLQALFGDRVVEPPPGTLTLTSYATALDERRAVCREVSRAVAEGARPDALAVVLPSLEVDGPEWLRGLRAQGLPVSTDLSTPVLSSARLAALFQLPSLEEAAFPRERMATFLELGAGPKVPRTDAATRLLAEAGIRDDRLGKDGGKGAYLVRLEKLALRWARRGNSEAAQAVRELSRACAALMAVAKALPVRATWVEHFRAWRRAVLALGDFAADGAAPRPGGAGELLHLAAWERAAAERCLSWANALEDGLGRLPESDVRVGRKAFQQLLLSEAESLVAPLGQPSEVGVSLLALEHVAGRAIQRVWLPGLVEGDFPRAVPSNPVFGEDARAQLNRSLRKEVFPVVGGEGEERALVPLLEGRLHAGLLLASTTASARCSSHRLDATGAERRPAALFDELGRAAGMAWALQPKAVGVKVRGVTTESELREAVAPELGEGQVGRWDARDPLAVALAQELGAEPWAEEVRALGRVEVERLRFFSDETSAPGPFTGAVTAEDVKAALAALFRFDAARPASATALGRFGNCRFQGFGTHVLRLREVERRGESINARTQGVFWHRVLEGLFRTLGERGLLDFPPEEIPDDLIEGVLDEAAAATEESMHVGHPVLWKLARERARALVRRMLLRDRARPFPSYQPKDMEQRFGGARAPAPWREVVIPAAFPGEAPIHLEGQIDRVDVGAEGLGVIDYKTGRLDRAQKREALLVSEFQLPIYLYAARSAGHGGPLSAAWLSLRDGRSLGLESLLGGQSVEALLGADAATRQQCEGFGLDNLANAVHALVGHLREGDFAPRAHDCENCGLRPVCRFGDRRLEAEP